METKYRNPLVTVDIIIEIDGGINETTINAASEAGADVFVAGSAIFGSHDYQKTISRFRELLGSS